MPLPRDQHPIKIERQPVFAGEGVESCHFYLSDEELSKIEEDGPPWKFEDAALITPALESPLVIFAGLNRDGYEDGYCYSFKPVGPGGQVFLVFVAKRFGLVVMDWEWRVEDNDRPGYPKDWDPCFPGGVVWERRQ